MPNFRGAQFWRIGVFKKFEIIFADHSTWYMVSAASIRYFNISRSLIFEVRWMPIREKREKYAPQNLAPYGSFHKFYILQKYYPFSDWYIMHLSMLRPPPVRG